MAKSSYLCFFLCLVPCFNLISADFNSCSAVKSEYNRQGFYDPVPDKPFKGTELKFCKGTDHNPPVTCCTKVMEHKLSVQSRIDFDAKLKKLLSPLGKLFDRSLRNYKEMFKNMLSHSKAGFNRQFKSTYGVIYEQNSAIVADLFNGLEAYFEHGHPDIKTQMDDFFKKLNVLIFTLFNEQYDIDDRYLACVTNHLEGWKTFGDVPAKLTVNLKRSFVAFRTFVQGIRTAASVVWNVLKVNPNMNCLHELMKMTHCSTCAGHMSVKPCLRYCLDVQQICFSHHKELEVQWKSFVDAMDKVGSRLEGPFSLGKEIEPIATRISNAVMNFQEAGYEISKKVIKGCGELRLARQRYTRSSRGELELSSVRFENSPKRNFRGESVRSKGVQFEMKIREMRTKMKNSLEFWSELPSEMCKEARHHGAAKCWNGHELGKYNESTLINQFKDMKNDKMDKEIFKLKVITNKLEEAYSGRDVSWIDEEWLSLNTSDRRHQQDDESYEGSGYGNVNTKPGHSQYPPDDEDGYNQEGSGYEPEEDLAEGSGHEVTRVHYGDRSDSVYEEVTPPKVRPPTRENPSSAPKEKPMNLFWAIAVYFLPAVFSFLGTLV